MGAYLGYGPAQFAEPDIAVDCTLQWERISCPGKGYDRQVVVVYMGKDLVSGEVLSGAVVDAARGSGCRRGGGGHGEAWKAFQAARFALWDVAVNCSQQWERTSCSGKGYSRQIVIVHVWEVFVSGQRISGDTRGY